MNQVQILVLDFGSQYTQLIARRLREFGVYTEIMPYFEKLESIKAKNPKGIILSGGPASVYEKDSYKPDSKIFELGVPVLGICYGMQYIAYHFGGKVIRAKEQEFGKARLEIIGNGSLDGHSAFSDKSLNLRSDFQSLTSSKLLQSSLDSNDFSSKILECQENDTSAEGEQSPILAQEATPLFQGVKQDSIVWMSHADKVEEIPSGFVELAKSGNTHYCVIADFKRQIYALQFHPEVVHSECGAQILRNFAVGICGASTDWNMKNFISYEIEKIRKITGLESNAQEEIGMKMQQKLFYEIKDTKEKEQIFTLWKESFFTAHNFMGERLLESIAKELKERIKRAKYFLVQKDSKDFIMAFGIYDLRDSHCHFECYLIDRSISQSDLTKAFLRTIKASHSDIQSFLTQWDKHDKKGLKAFDELGFKRGELSGDMLTLVLDCEKVQSDV